MNSSFRFHQSHFDTLATNIRETLTIHIQLIPCVVAYSFICLLVLRFNLLNNSNSIRCLISHHIFFVSLHLFHISFLMAFCILFEMVRKNCFCYRSCSWFLVHWLCAAFFLLQWLWSSSASSSIAMMVVFGTARHTKYGLFHLSAFFKSIHECLQRLKI